MKFLTAINFTSEHFLHISNGFPGKQFVNENFLFSKISIFIRVFSVPWWSNENFAQRFKCSTGRFTPDLVFRFSKNSLFHNLGFQICFIYITKILKMLNNGFTKIQTHTSYEVPYGDQFYV